MMRSHRSRNDFLDNLGKELILEFNEILRIEEDFWAMRSRVDWLALGDLRYYSSFFYKSTITRRRSNRILALKNSVEEWDWDPVSINNNFSRHFNNLLSSSSLLSEWSVETKPVCLKLLMMRMCCP